MPPPIAKSSIAVPELTRDDLVKSAEGLLQRAKDRFLNGAVAEAQALAAHAQQLVAGFDRIAADAIQELIDSFQQVAPPAPAAKD